MISTKTGTHSTKVETHFAKLATRSLNNGTHSMNNATRSANVGTHSVKFGTHSATHETRSANFGTHSVKFGTHSATHETRSANVGYPSAARVSNGLEKFSFTGLVPSRTTLVVSGVKSVYRGFDVEDSGGTGILYLSLSSASVKGRAARAARVLHAQAGSRHKFCTGRRNTNPSHTTPLPRSGDCTLSRAAPWRCGVKGRGKADSMRPTPLPR